MVNHDPFFKLSKYRLSTTVIFCGLLFSLTPSLALGVIIHKEKTDPPPKPRFSEGKKESNERPETLYLDKFGGSKEYQLPATGYWYLGDVVDRTMIIDPLGYPFSIIGVTEANTRAYRDETYEALYGGRETQWAKDTTKLLEEWQFNTLGVRARLDLLINPNVLRFPYLELVDTIKIEALDRKETDYPDMWDAEYQQKVIESVEDIINKHGQDEYFMGMMVANEANPCLRTVFGEWDPMAIWWKVLLKVDLGHDDALREFSALMNERYAGDIEAFNAVYETTFSTFDEIQTVGLKIFDPFETIEEGEKERGAMAYLDIAAWNAAMMKQLHKIVYDAAKARLPHILVFSNAFKNNFCDDEILQAIAEVSDITVLNHYVSGDNPVPDDNYLNYFAEKTGHPVFINEFSFTTPGHDAGIYPVAADQSARAEAFMQYRNAALANPNILGISWFALSDTSCQGYVGCGAEDGYINFGLESRDIVVYDEMITKGAELWSDPYKISLSLIRGTNGTEEKIPLKPTGTHSREFWGPPDPISHDKAKWYDLDPLVPSDGELKKYFKVDPLNPLNPGSKKDLNFDPIPPSGSLVEEKENPSLIDKQEGAK